MNAIRYTSLSTFVDAASKRRCVPVKDLLYHVRRLDEETAAEGHESRVSRVKSMFQKIKYRPHFQADWSTDGPIKGMLVFYTYDRVEDFLDNHVCK